MKVALLTDTHFGVRGDNLSFLELTKRFLDESFFPYIDEHGIKTVVHLGDLLDKRKVTNNHTMHRLRVDYVDPMMERGIAYHQILGNHDCFFRSTNAVSSVKEILTGYPVSVYEEAQEVELGGRTVLFMPWTCDDNREHNERLLRSTTATVCFGHLELAGFEMFRGAPLSHGIDRRTFEKFEQVFSGHYHHKSSSNNIDYLGSHMEFTWSDYDDPRGFHVYDTESRGLTFVQNTQRVFEKVWYDDSIEGAYYAFDKDNQSACDYSVYRQKIVKVIVKSKTSTELFDQFIDQIEKQSPIDLQIVEDHLNLGTIGDDEGVDETEDTMQICRRIVDGLGVSDAMKSDVIRTIQDLHDKALQIE